MPKDLRGFVEDNADSILRVPRTVAREHLSALIVQAGRPVMFESIEGFPGWRVLDLLFVDRRAQARVLDTAPDNVLASLAAALERPPVPPGGSRGVRTHIGAAQERGPSRGLPRLTARTNKEQRSA